MEAFLIYLLKSSAIVSLFYLVYFFLLRKDTFFTVNRHFLLVGILCSLLLPFLEFTTIEIAEQPNFQIITYNTTLTPENHSEPMNWGLIAFTIYIIITLLLLGRFGLQLLSLRRIFTKSQNKQKEEFSFIKTSKDIAPFSFFKYIIFNPTLHNSKELEMILKHEKIHAKQYHTIDILITNIFAIFQWMNPFSWLYKKSLQQNLEFIADQEAIRDLPSKKEYQLTLVKVSSNKYSSITNNFYQSLIKKRIVMLNKKESNYQNLWKAAVILPLLSIFLWSFNTKTEVHYIPNETQEQPLPPDVYQQKTVSDDSKKITFPVKKENPTTITEHAFPSKKEHPSTNEHPNTLKNKVVPKFPITTKTPTIKNSISKTENTNFKKNTIEFIINKNSTKKDLERVKRVFKNEYDVEIAFSNINRNQDDEITSISVTMSSKKSNANFSIENETPIKPVVISYNSKKEKIRIGQSRSDGKNDNVHIIEINPDDEDENIFIIESDKKHKRKLIRKTGGKNKIIIRGDHDDDKKTLFDFDSDSDKNPLFFIDGKKASEKDAKKLKSHDIESIDVSKGKASVKKYGKKAKDGVINITTKKGTKKGTGFNFKIDKEDYSTGSNHKDDNVIVYGISNSLFSTKMPSDVLVYVDGKKVDYQDLQKINTDQIESVNVYKDEKALTKFGSEGKNGVVEVILKK